MIDWVKVLEDCQYRLMNPYSFQVRKRKTWKALSEPLTEELYNDICDKPPKYRAPKLIPIRDKSIFSNV